MTCLQPCIVNPRRDYGKNCEGNCSIGTFQGLDEKEMVHQYHFDHLAVHHLLRLHSALSWALTGIYVIWANNVYDKEVDAIKKELVK
jgi:hypothetical protein